MVSQPADSSEADTPFIEYLSNTAGDQIVGIIRYSENGYTIEHHRARESTSSSHSNLDVGARHATVRLYEQVVVIDFPHPDAEGIIVIFHPPSPHDTQSSSRRANTSS